MKQKRPRGGLFHGTSRWALEQIRSATNNICPVYTESNISLGGTYITSRWEIAQVAARNAAYHHNSTPVILAVLIKHPLFPDEDWVVPVAERPSARVFDWQTETYKDERYENFFSDLFSEYPGEGFSLSDEYARRYEDLNDNHDITWKDSFRHLGSVRQEKPLDPDQIIGIHHIDL